MRLSQCAMVNYTHHFDLADDILEQQSIQIQISTQNCQAPA
jgi:hypothetical protein